MIWVLQAEYGYEYDLSWVGPLNGQELLSAADQVFNQYWQGHFATGSSCDFGGAAELHAGTHSASRGWRMPSLRSPGAATKLSRTEEQHVRALVRRREEAAMRELFEDELEHVKRTPWQKGQKTQIDFIPCNLDNPIEIKHVANVYCAKFFRLDVLINNAAQVNKQR